MQKEDVNKSIFNGVIWSVLGQFMYLAISLISNIVLARLLSPTEFGKMGIIMFFISVSSVFVESGFGGALVRKSSPSKLDYSTVFVFNLLVSLFLFVVLLFSSGLIAEFYNDLSIKAPLMVSGLILVFNAFSIIPNIQLIIDMKYKERYLYLIISSLISFGIAIVLALLNYGLWSLVVMYVLNPLLFSLILHSRLRIKLSLTFSAESFKQLFGFGFYTTMSSLISQVFNNVYQLVLGKYFTMSQVGYYYQANKIQDIPGGVLRMLSNGVVYSGLAKFQNDEKYMLTKYLQIITYLLVLLGFISIAVFVYAELIVKLILGSQWIHAIPYLRILTFASFFYIQESFNRVLFKIYNKTEQLLGLEVLKKIIQSFTIVVGVYYLDLFILLFGYVISSCLGYIINYYFSRKLPTVQVKSTSSELITTFKVFATLLVMVLLYFGTKSFINYGNFTALWTLIVYIPTYIVILIILNVITRNDILFVYNKIK